MRSSAAIDISILTPSFEHGVFLRDCVDSVIGQRPFLVGSVEHIVVDGGSTDESVSILSGYGDEVRWISERDSGISEGFNKALQMATGDWIAWLNADEFYLPSALDLLAREASRSGADVVYGDAIFVDEDGRFLRLLPQHRLVPSLLRRYGSTVQTVTALLRRSAVEAAGGLNPRSHLTTDWHLYIQLADRGAEFRHFPAPIGAFRIHGESLTSSTPFSEFEPELRWFRELHGVHRRAPYKEPLGQWVHRALKLANGAYLRQVRASRALKGRDMRWFRSAEAGDGHRWLQGLYGDASRC